MPAAAVPNVGRAAAKWARRAASAGGEYEEGVRTTPKDWAGNTAAAEKNYHAGVQAAMSAGRFAKGVTRAGNAKWKKGALEKGPGRFAQGVGLAEADYAKQMAPVLEVIGRTDLPPRGPAGSEANYQRSSVLGKALRAWRMGR